MTDTFQNLGDVAGTVVNRWLWWQNALKGNFGAFHSEPEQGYFRTRKKGGQWEPVAIWWDEDVGGWLAYRNGREVDADDVWTWACRNPISFEAYEKALKGDGFEDEPQAVVAPVGHNSGDADPFEAIKIELAGEAEMAAEFLKTEVTKQAQADKAATWAKRLSEISKRADKERETEKAPHLAASRGVDDKWRDVIADAKDMSAKLKRHVEGFLIAQKRAEEARAKAEAEKAERLRREAAEAARQAEAGQTQDDDSRADLIQQAQEAEKASEVRNASAGRTGSKVSLRTEKRARIVDFDKTYLALKSHPEMKALVETLANRAVRAGIPLDGVEVEEFEKVV